ncbi:MAG TPA: hypothetical protein VD908_11765 [Cytophagales bacterium]|nr:hypothetical protein [Cytophagales bacterium]
MTGFFEYEYLKFKKDHLKNLVALANSEGKMSEEEFKYLYKVGERYELKPKHIDSILAKKEEIAPAIPTAHKARVNQLYDFIQTMFLNGISTDKDIEYLKKLVVTFGFKEEFTDSLIKFYNERPHFDEEWDAFQNDSKKFNL